MQNEGILYWITGLSGAGKTTIGIALYYELKKTKNNVILLDGDILKTIIGESIGYSEEERRKRAKKYAQFCKMLTDQGMIVICCTIAMFDEVREWNRDNNRGYIEVYLKVPLEVLEERDQKGMYSKQKEGKFHNLTGIDIKAEFPQNSDIVIENDGRYSVEECVNRILNFPVTFSHNYDRDTQYWDDFYKRGRAKKAPSLFARTVINDMEKGKSLLELGCGNGRDSIFFGENGLQVTAIDASNVAISALQRNERKANMNFICDDFVCSPAVFVKQYDYCYSRFSLHAINEEQENEVIKNVFFALKEGGKFFVEVRSVNDELYGKGKCVAKHSFIYEGHFRRFCVLEELKKKLMKIGFEIENAEEKCDFAPYAGMNPPVIRIVAKK